MRFVPAQITPSEPSMTDLVQRQLQQSLDTLQQVLADGAIHAAVVQAGEITANAMKDGKKLMVCGNGGSAADAQHLAREMGIHTISYTGNGGGGMRELSDINVIVPSSTTMNIQESHLALEHILCMVVERFYFGPEFGSRPQQLAE